MAVNVLGQTVQLALNNTQLKDFTQNLKSGDMLRGRVVEVMQDGKAVVNFKGFAVLTELSANLFQSVQKGDILQVQVTALPQQNQNSSQQAANASLEPQPVSLKLVAVLNALSQTDPSLSTGTQNTQLRQAQIQSGLEASVRQAGFPVNENTLGAARSLAAAGLPVNAAQIQTILDAAAQLTQGNSTPSSATANGKDFQMLPVQAQQIITSARSLLTALSMGLNNTQEYLQIQQGLKVANTLTQFQQPAVSGTTQTTQGPGTNSVLPSAPTSTNTAAVFNSSPVPPPLNNPVPPAASPPLNNLMPPAASPPLNTSPSMSGTNPTPIPLNQSNSTPASQNTINPPAAASSAALGTPVTDQAAAQANTVSNPLQNALQQVAHVTASFQQNPVQSAQALTEALAQLAQVLQSAAPPASTQVSNQASVAAQNAIPATSSTQGSTAPFSTPPPLILHGLIFQETAQLLAQALAPTGSNPVFNTTLTQVINQLRSDLAIPQSKVSEELLSPVFSRAGQSLPALSNELVLSQAVQNLGLIGDAFANIPLTKSLTDVPALMTALQARGFETQADPLMAVPRQVLIDSLVFLQARELPLNAVLARPVAQAMIQGSNLGQRLENLIAPPPAQTNNAPLSLLPQPVSKALENLGQFLQNFGVRGTDPGLANQVRDFVFSSGLNLESTLSKFAVEPSQSFSQTNTALPQPTQDLKSALLNIQHQARQALSKPELSRSDSFARVLNIEKDASQALASLTTLQLAGVPTASHNNFAVQIPLWFGGQIETGHLSVYWKSGSEKQLSDKEPVQMVFVLNTRGLGEIKISLQLYKESCNCSVQVQDDETRAFFEPFLPELKAGLEKNTPFAVNSLDVGIAEQHASLEAAGPPQPASSLDISA